MEDEKIIEIAKKLQGLKEYEWSRIKVGVEKYFLSESSKLQLNDSERLARLIKSEF